MEQTARERVQVRCIIIIIACIIDRHFMLLLCTIIVASCFSFAPSLLHASTSRNYRCFILLLLCTIIHSSFFLQAEKDELERLAFDERHKGLKEGIPEGVPVRSAWDEPEPEPEFGYAHIMDAIDAAAGEYSLMPL